MNMKSLSLICGTILMVSIVAVFGVLKLDSNRADKDELMASTELSDTVYRGRKNSIKRFGY